MAQKDYILRMIEAIGLMVSRIKAMIGRGELAEARHDIAQAASRTGIALEIGRALDGESLLNVFVPAGSTTDPTNAMLFSEVLYLDGLMHRQLGNTQEACTCFAKSLLLLRAATASASSIGISYPEAEARIDELLGLMDVSNGD